MRPIPSAPSSAVLRVLIASTCSLAFALACNASEQHDDVVLAVADAGAPPAASGASTDASPPAETSAAAVAACAEPCPTGIGSHWSCDGSRRVRCVDGCLKAETCSSGCAAGADDEAVCSCGARASFSRWNCVAEGGRGSCAGGLDWIVDSCNGKTCTASEHGVSDACVNDGPLQDVVRQLGLSCSTLAPGVSCSISVRDLTTNARAGYEEQRLHVSASSAKVFWTAAALFDTSIAAVHPYAQPIFQDSDNIATAHVLELLSSPERVNTFLWQDVEVADIGFCDWSYGGSHYATNCPNVLDGDNFFTTTDAVTMLTALWDRSLLGAEKSASLLGWMTLSPRAGYGGWLGTQLPAPARSTMHHKAGWLPPAELPGYSNANEIGIVEVPNGHAYAVAFALEGASSQVAYETAELPLLEYLSCRVYHAVAGDGAQACVQP